jgi:hypothetical protein
VAVDAPAVLAVRHAGPVLGQIWPALYRSLVLASRKPRQRDRDLLAIAVAGRERSVARRNSIVQSVMEVKQRVALALAGPPVRQELIDAMLKFVELAPTRLQAASAHVRELRGDALGVLGPHRQLQPLTEPGDRPYRAHFH